MTNNDIDHGMTVVVIVTVTLLALLLAVVLVGFVLPLMDKICFYNVTSARKKD